MLAVTLSRAATELLFPVVFSFLGVPAVRSLYYTCLTLRNSISFACPVDPSHIHISSSVDIPFFPQRIQVCFRPLPAIPLIISFNIRPQSFPHVRRDLASTHLLRRTAH